MITVVNERPLEYIVWLDHWSPLATWSHDDPNDTVKEKVRVYTAGFVLAETKDQLVVAGSVTNLTSYSGATTILKNCIVERKVLKSKVKFK